MTGQRRWVSLVEQVCNVGSGFLIAMLLWRFVVVHIIDLEPDLGTNFKVTLLFTTVSVVRGFLWRRLFNKGTSNAQT